MSRLHRVSQGPKRFEGSVIFMHGLGGDPFATWRASSQDDFWPNWIAQDLPDVDIWTVEYEASPSTWHGSAMALPDRAANLLAWFETERLFEQPLIFVGHSLGGLVVKQLLRLSSDRPGTPVGRILTATRGVVFLGTPNTGSDLANWMDRLRVVLGASVATKDLQSDSAYLRELNGWYRERAPAEDIATLAFAETSATKGLVVVEQASADPGIMGVLPIPVDANHLSIAKPSSRDELVYRRIKQFVEERLPPSARPSIPRAVDRPTASQLKDSLSAYFENTAERCSHTSILFDRSKSVSLKSLYVRTYLEHSKSTMSDIKFRDFIVKLPANDSYRILLILGSAGTGKTFLLRWLFLTLLENRSPRIPFYVELRGIKDKEGLLPFLYHTIVGRRAKLSFSSFSSEIMQGEYIFILDGLDEVEYSKREGLIREIRELKAAYPGIILVISSRHDESLYGWGQARTYSILPMTKREAISVIQKLPYKSDVKKKFRMDVDASLYEQHRSFLSNPLLITIMLLTYSDLGSVPAKMHIFYEQAFETLFYRHDTWKEAGYQRTHYCALPVDEFRDCLSSFCISSYKKSQYEFTMLSAMDLINKASAFERLNVDASKFLKDLEESVCILRLEGITYKFTHRSFQEYFAAVFISRSPHIGIRRLLDALAVRRGDVVIPMAMEMNGNLIEREWVLPRMKDLVQVASDDTLRFAKQLFGSLVYEGTMSGLRIVWTPPPTTTRRKTQDVKEDLETGERINSEEGSGTADGITCEIDSSPNTNLRFVYILKELYPRHIGDIDGVLGEDDIAKIQGFWNDIRERWWNENQEKLRSGYVPRTNEIWPYPALLRSYKEASSYKEESAGSVEWAQFRAASDHDFAEWRRGRGSITDQDAGWFQLTSTAERLRLLASQIIALSQHLELSTERSKKIGAELLD